MNQSCLSSVLGLYLFLYFGAAVPIRHDSHANPNLIAISPTELVVEGISNVSVRFVRFLVSFFYLHCLGVAGAWLRIP